MIGIINKPDTDKKLRILSTDAQYDLACACATTKDEHRKRSRSGWIYPVSLPNGGTSILFKTLMSNVCNNDCKYCPLRENQDIERCSLSPEETANAFLDYLNARQVHGLFLSSSSFGTADNTMEKMISAVRLLRKKHKFRGYVHMKIIPGASAAAIEEAVSLSSAVSLNVEVPGEKYLSKLTEKKKFMEHIVEPIKLISRLTESGGKFAGVKQTTQFIVGAAGESDSEIVKYMGAMYSRLKMDRIYFSAYQNPMGEKNLWSQNLNTCDSNTLVREHRLYQADFLLRKYGFEAGEISFSEDGNLPLDKDPKEIWAMKHTDRFPVNVNKADRNELLRVPGLGLETVRKILEIRRQTKIKGIEEIGKVGARLNKAGNYIAF